MLLFVSLVLFFGGIYLLNYIIWNITVKEYNEDLKNIKTQLDSIDFDIEKLTNEIESLKFKRLNIVWVYDKTIILRDNAIKSRNRFLFK